MANDDSNFLDPELIERLEKLVEHLEQFLAEATDFQDDMSHIRNQDLIHYLEELHFYVDETKGFRDFLERLSLFLRYYLKTVRPMESFSSCNKPSYSTNFLWNSTRQVTQTPPAPDSAQQVCQTRPAPDSAQRVCQTRPAPDSTQNPPAPPKQPAAFCPGCGEKLQPSARFCPGCGEKLQPSARFCPGCGAKVTPVVPSVAISKVQFSALAPKRLLKGSYSILDIVMYEESCRKVVEELLSSSEVALQETRSGVITVGSGASVRIVLSSPDVQIEDAEETAIWNGEYLHFNFAVALPLDFRKRQALFTATVYINELIATRLKFVVKCLSLREQKLDIIREDVLTAFVSYASQDRSRVALLIQGMKKARPDMDIFFDVDSLRSGEDWQNILTAEIERRDILYLCWSHHAKASKWVEAEWRHALQHKGLDAIEPIPFEPPEVCPPPEELKRKHFNDKMLYMVQKS